ncbi:helix-turn-helix domain-containing protein [Salidesulfovibrio brasiliensis]
MPEVLKVKDVAKMLNCSESLVRRADMKQRLGAFTVGKRGIRFHRQAVEAYMRQGCVNVSEREVSKGCDAPRQRKRKLTSLHDLW